MNDLKKKIKEQSEIVFSIDKERDPNRFKNESMELVKYLYLYVLKRYKNNRTLLYKGNYEEYSLEIVKTGKNCIEKYNPNHEKGASFLTFFISRWELERLGIRQKEIFDGNPGPTISEEDRRLLGKLAKLQDFLRSRNIAFSPTLHLEVVAKVLEVSEKKALEIIFASNLRVDSIVMNEENEEISIYETVQNNELTPEQVVIEQEKWDSVMLKVEKGFECLSKRPKPYVIDIITCDIALILSYYHEDYSYNYSFVNVEMMEEILRTGNVPRKKDIAQKYSKTPQTLSRAYTNTIMQIREKQKEFERS